MTRFCANCGTEVDETAVFCPTCGQPVDQALETEMPAAPAWPEPNPPPGREEPPLPAPAAAQPAPPVAAPTGAAEAEAPPSPAAPGSPAAAGAPPQAVGTPAPGPPIQVTTPLMLSGWLIGVGAAIAAVGALISLFDGVRTVVDLLVLVAMAGVAASVFLASSLPAFGHLRLATLAIVLVALGVGTDRILGGVGGVGELLLFLGAAAAVIGAVLVEIGRDQPMGVAR
jgi:hypothetical protein